MKNIFLQDDCEAVLLVDADNAFNRLNREVALKNVGQLCPVIFQYIHNSYKEPAKLYLPDGSHILSKEGTTQGDNIAMGMYAIGTKPLIDKLHEETAREQVMQVWFADDSTAGGKIQGINTWWNSLKENGPKYGYFPKPKKTYLIVKDPRNLEMAQNFFKNDGVNITCDGERHIGAVIGSDEFKKTFVETKSSNWIKDVENLAEIAAEEPQAAFVAFNVGMSNRWSFLQRTLQGIAELFKPLGGNP